MLATLVGNALRAVGDATARRRTGQIAIDVGYDAADRVFELTVADNGPGVPEGALQWLFERGPRTGRSAGLALRMVKDVVAAHGGSVHATSGGAHGTRFVVRIPRGSPPHGG